MTHLFLLCFLSCEATQTHRSGSCILHRQCVFSSQTQPLSQFSFAGRTDLWSLWTIIAHWSDLAQQDKNKMAAWCHGEWGMMGGDRSLRGLLVSELRPGQPWRQVQCCAGLCPRPTPTGQSEQEQWGSFILLILAQNLSVPYSLTAKLLRQLSNKCYHALPF